MTVLQLISSSLGYYGAERVVVTLSSALGNLGVRTAVGTFANTAKTLHLEVHDHAVARGLPAELIPCHGRLDWTAVLAVRDMIDRYKIDVIHSHGIKPALYAYLASMARRVALVSTCHLWVFDTVEDWAISALERCLLHSADKVVVVSDHIVPQLRRFGVCADILYNGIETAPYFSGCPHYRDTLNWTGRPVIGAIGRLAPQKGLQNLLDAAPAILRDHPSTLFVFAGDGPDRQALEAQAKRLGVQDSVSFIGVRSDIPDLLASIDILAMPSLSEGLPMSLLEAMASGKPVVASSVGAVPRVVRTGVDGLLVEPGDVAALSTALKTLLDLPDLRAQIGARARTTVQSRFSAQYMAEQYFDIYLAAMASHGSLAGLNRRSPSFPSTR